MQGPLSRYRRFRRRRRRTTSFTVTFVVNPRQAVPPLTDVSFIGNQQIDEDELHKIVATTPRGGFRRIMQSLMRRPSGVTRGQINDDRDAIESFYRLAGFSEATVGEPWG